QGKESKWELESADNRASIIAKVRPAFATALDLTAVPENSDWSKVCYRGDLYFDFDADDDLPFVIEKFKDFLAKITSEYGFDLAQASIFLTGKKGLHCTIPQACFMPKVPPNGTPHLAYIYRAMAEAMVVDTMDLSVFTGKRGRQWRTPNVLRENGTYKVPVTVDEALDLDEATYLELIKTPRHVPDPTPPTCNVALSMLFERSKEKVTQQQRGRKKRLEK